MTKSYPFTIIVENIYNQTGLINLTVTVDPGCGDAEGCGAKLWIYTGMSLSQAEDNYPLTGLWYNGRFLKVSSPERPVLT